LASISIGRRARTCCATFNALGDIGGVVQRCSAYKMAAATPLASKPAISLSLSFRNGSCFMLDAFSAAFVGCARPLITPNMRRLATPMMARISQNVLVFTVLSVLSEPSFHLGPRGKAAQAAGQAMSAATKQVVVRPTV
jgi:hypothetical protein